LTNLFPEISDPFFHNANPLDRHQPHKVNLISLGLIPDTPSYILLYPTNPEPSSYFLPYPADLEPTPYFLPFPGSSYVSLVIHMHFIEVCILHSFIESVIFTSYFWKTLWYLLGAHVTFSCAYQTRVKPGEPIVC